MNVLAIGAHPDDIEYGCGGTLIRYSHEGHRVFLFIMTKGAAGGDPDIREKEQESSASIIGVKDIFWGGYEDTNLPVTRQLIIRLENVIDKINPDLILVNHRYDTHQDHRNLADATISATRNAKNLLFFEVPTTYNFVANIFVDITDVLQQKLECLKAHFSQITKTNINSMSILELVTSTANFRGIQSRVKYAEGFISSRLFIQI
ncbi:MAG: PIG-L deacetylase family protein [bacterium]